MLIKRANLFFKLTRCFFRTGLLHVENFRSFGTVVDRTASREIGLGVKLVLDLFAVGRLFSIDKWSAVIDFFA